MDLKARRDNVSKQYGYVRVSTMEQNEDRQLIAMKNFGLDEKYIFVEKKSGKNFERPVFINLINTMGCEDTLVIKSIDRLGRNYEEILEQWRIITKEKKISIVVLDMPLLDTRKDRDLTGILIADIVLQLLSYVAQTERENIRQRQMEGISAAKKKGIHLGRPAIEIPDEFKKVREEYSKGLLSSKEASKKLSVSVSTFLRWVRRENR